MSKRMRISRNITAMLAAFIAMTAAFAFGRGGVAYADDGSAVTALGDGLYVHFVDVGQGDACIIEFPDDKTMLIDAGENKKENKEALLGYIQKNINDSQGNDIKYFDYAILTHPDSDHCGGMADVLKKYPAKTFYRPNVYAEDKNENDGFSDPAVDIKNFGKNNIKDTTVYYNAIKAGYNPDKINGVETTVYVSDSANEEISIIEPSVDKQDDDYYSFTFYAPIEKSFSGEGQWNNYSPIMILEYHDKRFVFSGDAEEKALASFVAAAKEGEGKYSVFDDDYTVDVFKLGHHGSRNATTAEYLETLTTEASCPNLAAVISCGEGNSYGHPHKEALDILTSHGVKSENILRTDVMGDIAFSVRRNESGNDWKLYLGDAARPSMPENENKASGNAQEPQGFTLTRKQMIIIAVIVAVLLIIVLTVFIVSNRRRHGRKRR